MLANDMLEDAPSTLASNLWIEYRGSSDWIWKVWDNTIASLRQVPALASDQTAQIVCARRYGIFLKHVDEHLPTGLDDQVLNWFLGRGKNELARLSDGVWQLLQILLLHLISHDALKTTTVLEGLVYPTWKSCENNTIDAQHLEPSLRAANQIVRSVLLLDDETGFSLQQERRIQSSRHEVFEMPRLRALLAHIPVLVRLESHASIQADLQDEIRSIRLAICEDKDFRRCICYNLDVVKDTFDGAIDLTTSSNEDLTQRLVKGFRIVLGERSDGR
jgi:mediator of RNA polymerase II transcription subunit 12, fungi type